MNKLLTDIVKEQGALTAEESTSEWDGYPLEKGNIVFENEAQLRATIDAVNAQMGNPVGYVSSLPISNPAAIRKDKNEALYIPLFAAPQTLPPEWAEWIELIEGALEDECGGKCNAENNPCWARELLLSKTKG